MMHHALSIGTASLLAFVLAVAVTDLRRRRIPNLLTLPAAAVGLAVNLSTAGGLGALESIGGLLAGLAAFLPFYIARGFGAGDVKAMAAIGAFLGPQGALLAAAWILIAGAIGGVLVLLVCGRHGAIQALARRWMLRVYLICTTGQLPQIQAPAGDAAALRFPYGLAIACGTFASLAWS